MSSLCWNVNVKPVSWAPVCSPPVASPCSSNKSQFLYLPCKAMWPAQLFSGLLSLLQPLTTVTLAFLTLKYAKIFFSSKGSLLLLIPQSRSLFRNICTSGSFMPFCALGLTCQEELPSNSTWNSYFVTLSLSQTSSCIMFCLAPESPT